MFPTGKPLFDACFEGDHGKYIVAERLLDLRDYLDVVVGWRV